MSPGLQRDNSYSLREQLITIGVVLVIACAVWYPQSGTPAIPWPGLLISLSLLPLAAWLLCPDPVYGYRHRLISLLRDPVFFCVLLFLTLLLLQLWNAPRLELVRIGEEGAIEVYYGEPPHPGWPFAFQKAEAAQMIRWFFPALVILLVIRHGLHSVKANRYLLYSLAIMAGLNACLGFLQFFLDYEQMYGIYAVDGMFFFSSFPYPNHAAAYYLLNLGIAFGVLVNLFRQRFLQGVRLSITAWMFVLLALFLGANFSLSRYGIAASWLMLVIAVLFFFSGVWRRMVPVMKFNIFVAILGCIGLGYFLVSGLGNDLLAAELDKLNTRSFEKDFNTRRIQVEAAWKVIQDYPLFGTGGWGYRYLIRFPRYLAPDQLDLFAGYLRAGNIHNDLFQFITEFGFIGFGLLSGVGLGVIISASRYMYQSEGDLGMYMQRPLCFLCLLGVGIVMIQSMVDLPFRNPAVLLTLMAVLASCVRAADDPGSYALGTEYD